MPIDYSKWDNLELSDDSDVECHPNIEKNTFIRLRQRKIREEREARRLRQERADALVAMNTDLVARIEALQDQVSAADEKELEKISQQWEKDAEQSRGFTERRSKAIEAGEQPEAPSEEEMLAALKARISDDLLKAAKATDSLEDKRREYTAQLAAHMDKLRKSLDNAKREQEEASRDIAKHIDPESIAQGGFDRSFTSKASSSKASSSKDASTPAAKATVTTDEVLNPQSVGKFDGAAAAGSSTDEIDADAIDEDGGLRIDDDAKKFAGLTNMSDSMDYILKHLSVVSNEKADQIMGHAFTHELAGRSQLSKQYVHQGLILTYILQMGSSGVNAFFGRIGQKGSQAQTMFLNDVNSRFEHIQKRCKVIKSETEQEGGEVESIQLQTGSPDAPIKTSVPDEANPDEDPERIELFKQLPAAFQNALKQGTIDALNEVLATIPGSEAEHILEICGQGQFLIIDEEIIVDPNEESAQ